MAERILTRDEALGVTETFAYDDASHTVVHRYAQDIEPVLDAVAEANLHGTGEIEGLGRLVMEVPVTVAINFCTRRGIPWEAFLYRNDYDTEFKRFAAEHQRLAYSKRAKTVVAR